MTATLGTGILSDAAMMGIRSAVGIIFAVQGYSKIGNEGFIGWMASVGVPPELAMIIAVGEVAAGIMLVIGALSRISASVIALLMTAAIFYLKEAKALTGDDGIDYNLVLLAASLLIIVAGPGRVSLSHLIKKIPRPLS